MIRLGKGREVCTFYVFTICLVLRYECRQKLHQPDGPTARAFYAILAYFLEGTEGCSVGKEAGGWAGRRCLVLTTDNINSKQFYRGRLDEGYPFYCGKRWVLTVLPLYEVSNSDLT